MPVFSRIVHLLPVIVEMLGGQISVLSLLTHDEWTRGKIGYIFVVNLPQEIMSKLKKKIIKKNNQFLMVKQNFMQNYYLSQHIPYFIVYHLLEFLNIIHDLQNIFRG